MSKLISKTTIYLPVERVGSHQQNERDNSSNRTRHAGEIMSQSREDEVKEKSGVCPLLQVLEYLVKIAITPRIFVTGNT